MDTPQLRELLAAFLRAHDHCVQPYPNVVAQARVAVAAPGPQLFRVAIRRKETDKRKNATVYHFIVMATTLDEAKTLAVAKWVDPPRYEYRTNDLDKIAAVTGDAMETLVYNSDIRGSHTKDERPETLPTPEAIAAARLVIDAFEAAHETPE